MQLTNKKKVTEKQVTTNIFVAEPLQRNLVTKELSLNHIG